MWKYFSKNYNIKHLICFQTRLYSHGQNGGSRHKVLTLKNLNPLIKSEHTNPQTSKTFQEANTLEENLKFNKELPYDTIIRADTADTRATGTKSITFLRQVIALAACKDLLKNHHIPDDVKNRTKFLLRFFKGSIGSYTNIKGVSIIRNHLADYIEQRDKEPAEPEEIFICSGATDAFKTLMVLLNNKVSGKDPCVLMPIPSWPNYKFIAHVNGIKTTPYYLNEDNNWSIETKYLQAALKKAHNERCKPRAIVVINPGMPTGAVLSENNIREVIDFASHSKLLIIALEVYQNNVYSKSLPFNSFKKVIRNMNEHTVELASIMNVANAPLNELGFKGGYIELVNFKQAIRDLFYVGINSGHCASTVGQIALDILAKPPAKTDISYHRYYKETQFNMNVLKVRAELLTKAYNCTEGLCCNPVKGGLAAFVKIKLPEKIIKEAKDNDLTPDEYFSLELLRNTGVSVTPGTVFGQKPGTHHFYTTILPEMTLFHRMLTKVTEFYKYFCDNEEPEVKKVKGKKS